MAQKTRALAHACCKAGSGHDTAEPELAGARVAKGMQVQPGVGTRVRRGVAVAGGGGSNRRWWQ